MVFGPNLCEKRQIWVTKSHFMGVRGDAWPWLMARWKARGRLSIRVHWTFLAVNYSSGVMRRNAYSSAVSTGGSTSLHSNFTWTGRLHQPFFAPKKLETPCYAMVKTASLCVPSFCHNTEVCRTDERTDGQTDNTCKGTCSFAVR